MSALNDTPQIQENGLYRMREFTAAVKVSREKLRQLSKQGKAPKPIRMGNRCTLYSGKSILKFIADPLNYCEEV